tara:strand:+ start:31 stop:207 length:177 start_codon:yes stop_codon:yes gene_type:complete
MKKIKLSKLIKQLNAEHEPPGGWRASDQADKLASKLLNGRVGPQAVKRATSRGAPKLN